MKSPTRSLPRIRGAKSKRNVFKKINLFKIKREIKAFNKCFRSFDPQGEKTREGVWKSSIKEAKEEPIFYSMLKSSIEKCITSIYFQKENASCCWSTLEIEYTIKWIANLFFKIKKKWTATWLILPVVIRSSQRLSHACVSLNTFKQWNCEWLIISVIVYLIVSHY